MNKFLRLVLLFLLPIIVLGIGLEIGLRNIPNDYVYKREYLKNNADSIEVLFLGSSHAYFGINPQFINKKSFNAGQVAQSIGYDYKILERYFSNSKKLEAIVVPVSYFSFHYKIETGTESWRVKNYSIYHDLYTTNRLNDYSEILSNSVKSGMLRVYNYYLKDKAEIACSKLGYGLNNTYAKRRDLAETGAHTAKMHTYPDLADFEENYQAMLSIIKFAEQRNIKVLLYTPPAFETYVKNLYPVQLNKAITTAQALDKAFENTYYINLLQDRAFVERDFYDADHMNEFGAEKLTKKIDSVLSDFTRYQQLQQQEPAPKVLTSSMEFQQ
ncbi:hypothetical protein [Cesiribacter sp. SM1]|uniref:hypothetical protein n=1 Tax=Cesiribacter sp. SM1 TaxID=2861196 RepID=UPI001CD202B9|nr:hypothetical protein [Cesiribacter sp. SM1]